MGKLNWRDVGFLTREVARIYVKYGYDQGDGAQILALAWCQELKPGFDAEQFIREVNEVRNDRYGLPA